MKISVIDVGSNSVRLATMADGKTLYKRMNTTRLGEGLYLSGLISEAAAERTAQAVAEFYALAKHDGARKIYVFATAAVRSAPNRNIFLEKVEKLCGAQVEVISGETEAQIGILGALKGRDGGIIDVGGASTEVIINSNGKTVYSKSVNIGAVRLFDAAGRDKSELLKIIERSAEEFGDFPAQEYDFVAIGGTAGRLAAIEHNLKEYRPEITHGTVFTLDGLSAMADRLLNMSVKQIRSTTVCGKSSELVGGGALLLCAVMRKFGVKKIAVSESDNLEGYFYLKEGIK